MLHLLMFLCSFVLLCGLVLVNFVIGVIIDNMQSNNDSEDTPIRRGDIDKFVKVLHTVDVFPQKIVGRQHGT